MAERSGALNRALIPRTSDFGVRDYEAIFGLRPIEWSRMKGLVLELGSGTEESFARKLQSMNPNVEVVNVNPHLSDATIVPDPTKVTNLYLDTNQTRKAVAALAQGFLPFKDDSFEVLFAVHSAPEFLRKEEISILLQEGYRVLGPGGRGFFWPLIFQGVGSAQHVSSSDLFLAGVPYKSVDVDEKFRKKLKTPDYSTFLLVEKPPPHR
ncbi:hypothetical protein A3G67_03875 [Candidatus Roizmanbacteria bacterium RIFCSPLOWO2_12_FULL_40_12]|uniref:Methyltransferase type 11 domain-containing protein n=1 Tax=Candidatus Roizmanbacteria bacterium RIFCSPLOWO2_01_FULL_40_42 TaxID=1802066 RepID=A0A1F7J5U1_9BACT|nr:MAG: hypothetical protein A2779_03510 [Candidatus Roizmanbacteria bacterium RIFCSPHIGHO2_01_FULL_40_98]OGK28402.1 MAG: hypothetical protein A3C31_00875 [Candidatus Roizmanbacteria bacterium RIFCSPHIGHO2_02_FULL_40_53]OGK30638.1 MAG: hypothetical protein A2W49_03560 [Candidatus Roizmanbacteria bacterium RIFCSPHIGHO2_12_41_18]OGK35966.1 MAG: hypothetical protein A3E69_03245 [Candidatus Roizmanbacteria bacterium RIFCSPHIGHO2_12_FULL_40_130]OGK50958.1 MAG: hypothetical protein A3B50_01645 [Candi